MPDPISTCGATADVGQEARACTPFTWSAAARLIRLTNQTGTLLLLLPTMWALVLASAGRPSVLLLTIFTAGALIMRSAGVIMNDLADRRLDRQIARTQSRPLASGAISVPAALVILAVLLAVAAVLLAFLTPLAIVLSPIAIVLAALYPFSKRIVHIPQAMLGVAFGWGVVMAWAAVQNRLPVQAWLLYGATICWAVAYDSIYALQDRQDDVKVGVKSSAVLFGTHTWIAVGVTLAIMFLLLGLIGWWLGLNGGFYGMLVAVAGFLSQQVWRLRAPVSPAEAFRLFRQHAWVGAVILAGVWIGYL